MPRKIAAEKIGLIFDLKAKGMILSDIADKLHICQATVFNYLNPGDISMYRDELRMPYISILQKHEEPANYCSHFGCGRKLTIEQQLYGNKCPEHQPKEVVSRTDNINYIKGLSHLYAERLKYLEK